MDKKIKVDLLKPIPEDVRLDSIYCPGCKEAMFISIPAEIAQLSDTRIQAHELVDGSLLFILISPSGRAPQFKTHFFECPFCSAKISYTGAKGRIKIGGMYEP